MLNKHTILKKILLSILFFQIINNLKLYKQNLVQDQNITTSNLKNLTEGTNNNTILLTNNTKAGLNNTFINNHIIIGPNSILGQDQSFVNSNLTFTGLAFVKEANLTNTTISFVDVLQNQTLPANLTNQTLPNVSIISAVIGTPIIVAAAVPAVVPVITQPVTPNFTIPTGTAGIPGRNLTVPLVNVIPALPDAVITGPLPAPVSTNTSITGATISPTGEIIPQSIEGANGNNTAIGQVGSAIGNVTSATTNTAANIAKAAGITAGNAANGVAAAANNAGAAVSNAASGAGINPSNS